MELLGKRVMSNNRDYPVNGQNTQRLANARQVPAGRAARSPEQRAFADAGAHRSAPSASGGRRVNAMPAAAVGAGAYQPAAPVAVPVKKRRTFWRVVFWLALVVLLVSVAALGCIAFSYWQGRDANTSTAEAFPEPSDAQLLSLADLTVDWDALLAVNPDTVGWIYIPGTVVNYPIVQTDNNETYLKTDFQGETNWFVSFGSIFLDASNAADFSDQNSIIYGHNMNDGAIFGGEGSMFSAIASLDDPDAFNATRTVYLLTPQGNYRLRSFSLVHTEATDPIVQTSFASAADLESYVQDKMDRTVQASTATLPAAADIKQVFTFSTCDNLPTDGRYVLFCYVEESTAPGARAVGTSMSGATAETSNDIQAAADAAAAESSGESN